MPIKGLTDRPAAFPEIGRIRKGAPKETNKPGADLTYFRVEFDEEEKQAIAIFHKAYGGTPSELNILLPFNSVDENFDAWREAYVASGLVHRCDGERVWYEIDPKSGDQLVVNGIPEEQCNRSSGCKPTGRLKVLIPELQRLAYLTVITGSIHDVMNIARQLEALLQINGKLAGIPLKLRRRPIKISTPSGTDGKRARRTKSLLSIEADPEWVRHKLLSMKAAALPDNGLDEDTPALEAPADYVEGEVVEDFPFNGDDEPTDPPPDPVTDETRPYSAEFTKLRIATKVLHYQGEGRTHTPKQHGLAMGCLNLCFAGDEQSEAKRKTVLAYLFGVDSGKDIATPETLALLDWLEPTKDTGDAYEPNPLAVKEALKIVTARIKELGQETLFPGE